MPQSCMICSIFNKNEVNCQRSTGKYCKLYNIFARHLVFLGKLL